MKSFAIFTAKGTSLREYTSFKPFCVKIGWGLTSRGGPEESQKVTRGYHRNDVSPLKQGMRYRAACDVNATRMRHLSH